MDELKQIYDEIIEESHEKKGHGKIDVREFAEFDINKITRAILRRYECFETGIDPDVDPTYNEILNEKPPRSERPKRITREERYILTAKRIREVNLDVGDVIACELSTYRTSYEYSSLSFEEFCSYIFWRTQTRNNQILQAPIPYIWLYLAELCNFIEYDTIEETISMLSFLLSTQKHQRAKTIIREAISDFLVYYGDSETLKEYDTEICKFNSVKNSLFFLNGTHSDPFDYVVSYSSYKIKESEIYNECPKTVRKYFMSFFYKIVDLLRVEGVDLLALWIGQYELAKRHELLIKEVKFNLVVEKQLIEDGILLRSVTQGGAYEATMKPLGQDVDPGERIFYRNYIIDYPIQFFDNELRKITGKKQIDISTKKLHEMAGRGEKDNLNKIIEFYESDIFTDCIESCLRLCIEELLQERKEYLEHSKEENEYIYCEIEFENTSKKFSYITDDKSITVGDMVVVPTGVYNFESIAIVRSIKRCTSENAPYPPLKTKKIIRKHIQ